LPKGDHCTVDIFFSVDTVGKFEATLDIESDDPEQPILGIPLTGVVSEAITPNTSGDSSGGGCFICGLI
jgi:hypothetical protein